MGAGTEGHGLGRVVERRMGVGGSDEAIKGSGPKARAERGWEREEGSFLGDRQDFA